MSVLIETSNGVVVDAVGEESGEASICVVSESAGAKVSEVGARRKVAGKAAGAIFGTVTLMGGVVAAPVLVADDAFAVESAVGIAAEVTASEQSAVEADPGVRSASAVEGEFSFTQGVVTSSGTISSVFCKAASVVCASLPQYGIECARMAIDIASGDVLLSATVEEMSEEDAVSHLMGCSCASNVAGGGAIANAEVSGASVAAIAALAGAL